MVDSNWWFNKQKYHSHKTPKNKSKPLYSCINSDCNQRTTKNQAQNNEWYCIHCHYELKIRKEKIRKYFKLKNELGF